MVAWLRSLFGKSKGAGSSSDGGDTARALFMAEAEEVLRSTARVAGVSRDEAAFALDIETADGHEERAFLENHFLETREMSPEDRRARLRVAFSAIGKRSVPTTWETAKTQLMPVLRGATFGIVPPSELRGGAKPSGPLKRPFAPFIDVMVVVDRPTDMMYVTAATMEEWTVSADDVLAAALANFRERADLEADLYDDLHGPLFHVQSGDSYEASRLLVPGWLASFRGRVEGDPVAIVPHRDLLFVGGSARPEMIARLAQMAQTEFEASPRRVSSALYTVDADDEVVPYHSEMQDVAIAHAKLAIFEYGQQAALLEASDEWKAYRDWYVASYTVYGRDDGILVTSTWTKGVDTLLPEVEVVILVVLDEDDRPGRRPMPVPWSAIAGRLERVPDMHPPRWKTGRFPDDAALAELARLEI